MKKNYSNKIGKNKPYFVKAILLAAFSGMIASLGLNSQNSYTFTSAGVTGPTGPTQTQVNTAYSTTNLNGSVTVSNGIQSFTVPASGPYRITAIGGQGGYIGGFGASMSGDFTLTAGTVLKILVGQAGTSMGNGNYVAGGGGGGSFVSSIANVPYVVAGGGGGGGDGYIGGAANNTIVGISAAITTTGYAYPFPTGGTNGGSGGNGGTCAPSLPAGSGAGYNGNGVICSSGAAPLSYTNGGAGGTGTSGGSGDGGFGGGAGGYSSGVGNRGGGGGGYSGGGGGTAISSEPQAPGGGGGSYNAGVNQTNAVSTSTGSGRVIIDLLCDIHISSSGSSSVSPIICSGQSVTLTTNAASNYTWSNGNSSTTSIVVSPTVTTSYSIVGTSSTSCNSSGAIVVMVNSGLPVLTITNTPNNICLGKTATLTAGGANTYTWTNGVINGQSFSPASTATYVVTGQNGCGTSTAVTSITVAPLVVSASANPINICEGTTTTLTAVSSINGYTWQPSGATGSTVVLSALAPTIYTVTASDGTCAGTATVSITTKQSPTVTIVASTATVCEGAAVTLTASGALTYTWTNPVATGSVVSGNPTIPTQYAVSGTNSLNCVSTVATYVVFTNPTPTISIVANSTLICAGGTVNLSASGAANYNWTNGPATAVNIVTPQTTSTYTVSGTSANSNCAGTKTIAINVLTPSVSVVASSSGICIGSSSTLTASGANAYSWPGIGNGAAINVTPTTTTIYTVNATTTSGTLSCQTSSNITVTVFDNPTVTIVASKTVMCKDDAGPKLTANGALVSYTWSNGANTQTVNVSPSLTNRTFSVTVTDANGCTNETSIQITVNSCTGLLEINNNEHLISVYPNPSNGEFTVSVKSDMQLRLINEIGQLVELLEFTADNKHQVYVKDLSNGIYFIVGQNNNSQISKKIIVMK